ncbi:unnamed protein product [Dimorphilus gyrociliatus]|uniref:RNA-binding region-containing protein 3 n=1 Tax=Dimorphilus gyrociliatus TaxID=2664684 RepID=A0A7I8VQ11_9ANNE|nr:unnamed protein product [Dimorphilus gyrociliatus]
MTEPNCTIIVRNLPAELSNDKKTALLEHFGASNVKCMGSAGKLKHCAFGCFPSQEIALSAVKRLHQLEILGRRLKAELSHECYRSHHPSRMNYREAACEEDASTGKDDFWLDLHSLSDLFKVKYPLNPKLYYKYPRPNYCTLLNISKALVGVPRFYTQVLHLMNKMNLPPPFEEIHPGPPIPFPQNTNLEPVKMETESESEIESSEDHLITITKKRKIKEDKKRAKHKLQKISHGSAKRAKYSVEELFDVTLKKISKPLNLPANIATREKRSAESNVNVKTGFGKIEPLPIPEEEPVEVPAENVEVKFLTRDELKKKQLVESEIIKEKVFKKYSKGEASCRLYVKNLSKRVTEDDLRSIYGGFVDWNNEIEKNAFDIRLMQSGRMKGQAFISFSSENLASEALSLTNAVLLFDKPIVVSFARTAKARNS